VDAFRAKVADLPPTERMQATLWGESWLGRAVADGGGRFRIPDLPPGPWYVRAFLSERVGLKHRQLLGEATVEEGQDDVAISLAAKDDATPGTAVVEGEVVDGSGLAVTDYHAYLRTEEGGLSPVLRGRRFRFEGVPAGRYTLGVQDVRGGRKAEVPVSVREGESHFQRVVLTDTVTLGVRILDPAGAPVAGVHVRASVGGREHGARLTGEDGWARIQDLVPGRYALTLTGGTNREARVQLPVTEIDVGPGGREVSLSALAAGRLVLVFDDERYATEWSQQITEPGRHSGLAEIELIGNDRTLRARGLFRGRHPVSPFGVIFPLPGPYRLRVTTHAHGTFERDVAIRAGEDTVVEVRLPD
jgi:hypothetical protein